MIIHGDNLIEMKKLADDSVDLIITSPPYAEQRKDTYGGIPEDKYIEWFLPRALEMKRILKPTGSFFLNIKPHCEDGERSLYVFKLVIALKEVAGFNFVEEYSWVKNSFPGKFRGRFKNAFEPVYHFTKGDIKKITFNPAACATEVKPESLERSYRAMHGVSKNGSGMKGNGIKHQGLELALPDNVIRVNNVSNQWMNKQFHSATFPVGLCDFFIKSFTNKGQLVLDPFGGSGTTAVSSIENGRDYIIIEKQPENIPLIKTRISNTQHPLL